MPSSRSGLYDDPLIYDVLHAPGTAEEVAGLEAIEARFVTAEAPRLWLEPACGSGRYLRVAAERGTDVLGFDLSPAMIDYAKGRAGREGPDSYFVGDMTDFAGRLGRRRATFAFNLINTIRHLPSDRAMLDHLEQVALALAPGGVYVVGISLSAYGAESPSEDVWTGRRGRVRVTQVVQFIPPGWDGNPRPRSERVINHLSIERPTGTEHRDSVYPLRSYSPEEWRSLIEASAMTLEATTDEVGEPHEVGAGGYGLFILRPEHRSRRAAAK